MITAFMIQYLELLRTHEELESKIRTAQQDATRLQGALAVALSSGEDSEILKQMYKSVSGLTQLWEIAENEAAQAIAKHS
jgi:hypothetical protein